MIKFFRHIRKSLIEQNKMGKYLKYAIGEILLVVIGILIALQINNWNNNRIEHQKENQYLKSLLVDLNSQLERMEYMISEESINISDLDELLLNKDKILSSQLNHELLQKFSSVFDRTTYVLFKPTYSQLISTGDIGIISNDTLKNSIVSYYEKMAQTEKILQKNNDVKDMVTNPEFIRNIDISAIGLLKAEALKNAFISVFSLESLPTLLEETNSNLSDPKAAFTMFNYTKYKWLATVVTINYLNQDAKATKELMKQIELYLSND